MPESPPSKNPNVTPDFAWGFAAGMALTLIVSVTYGASKYWELWQAHKELKWKLSQADDRIVHMEQLSNPVYWLPTKEEL